MDNVIDWLLQSDPSVIFQTKRELLGLSEEDWKKDQNKMTSEGWGKQLLDLQDPDGKWGSNLYSPKFISTHYTLLLLRRLGMPNNEQIKKGCDQLLNIESIGKVDINNNRIGQCITGMGLGILAHFQYHDELFPGIIEFLENRQLEDGGWNCRHPRIKTKHSSLNTTLSVLDGLAILEKNYPEYKQKIIKLRDPAHEFLLVHDLFKSHRTGKLIHPQFTEISFPPRWKYNILSALDYFQSISFPYDKRMADAIIIIKQKEKNGKWTKGKKIPGKIFFDLSGSREFDPFNTLRALRVLKMYDDKKF